MDKLIKWLIVGVVVMGLGLLGLVAYKQGWLKINQKNIDMANKFVVVPGTPSINPVETSLISDTSTRGLFKGIDGDQMGLNIVNSDGSNAVVTWKLTDQTTAACTSDLYVDTNGVTKRRSNEYVNYNKEDMMQPLSNKIDWVKENAKIDSSVMVYGDKSTMTAKTIYLYMDKCL